jgi:L-lactate dehydrogenase complex protein LldF
LRCIRCGACMNHCPVYCAIGGHAYGSVYPGPIGAVLTPALAGLPEAGHLAQASTFCGRCEEVCPVEIPLVSLMRHWREMAIDEPSSWRSRTLLRAWAWLAEHPRAYRPIARMAAGTLGLLGSTRGRLSALPFGERWTRHRDFPAPQGRTFQDLYARRKREAAP